MGTVRRYVAAGVAAAAAGRLHPCAAARRRLFPRAGRAGGSGVPAPHPGRGARAAGHSGRARRGRSRAGGRAGGAEGRPQGAQTAARRPRRPRRQGASAKCHAALPPHRRSARPGAREAAPRARRLRWQPCGARAGSPGRNRGAGRPSSARRGQRTNSTPGRVASPPPRTTPLPPDTRDSAEQPPRRAGRAGLEPRAASRSERARPPRAPPPPGRSWLGGLAWL
jgi:hypothetical protein